MSAYISISFIIIRISLIQYFAVYSFSVILNCWNSKRPKFAHLVMQFSTYLEQESGYLALSPNVISEAKFKQENRQFFVSDIELVEKTCK